MTKPIAILEKYPEYEVTIGIEVHVQLATKTKIFCRCSCDVGKNPNTNICQICVGHPGSLPTLNNKVIDYALLLGLATKSVIAKESYFDRKHYFYPDLPKGYQITQQFKPICTEGSVIIRTLNGNEKQIRLFRIHIEEDAGKNIHATGEQVSFVDLNRAGTPLLEVVSYPDISNAYEARAYLKALRSIVQYLGICSGNMEEGAFRADTNISVRKKGAKELGTKCELKNINSFKFISDAIEYEVERQITLLENDGKVLQETRLWDTKNHRTVLMRTKEEAADYRYFPDPDLTPICVNDTMLDQAKALMPELPYDKFNRLVHHGLTLAEAEILVDNPELGLFFDQAYAYTKSKQLINWILRDLVSYLKEHKIHINNCKMNPIMLASLVTMIDDGKISNTVARDLFADIIKTGTDPIVLVRDRGLEQKSSIDELQIIVKTLLKEYPQEVSQYKISGNQRMLGFFIGKAMQKMAGKGNPKIISDLVKQLLDK